MTLTASPRRVATQETTQPADRRPPDSTTFAAHKHRARRQRQERQTVETGRNQGPRRAAPGSLLRHTQDVAPAFPTRPRATAVTDLSSSRDELQERAGERGRPPRRDWRCGSGGQPARCGPRGLRRSRLPLRHCADGRQLAGLRCYRRSSAAEASVTPAGSDAPRLEPEAVSPTPICGAAAVAIPGRARARRTWRSVPRPLRGAAGR